MALLKGKFVSKDEAIQSNSDPVDSKDLSRKSYVDSAAASAASSAAADKVSKAGDTMTGDLVIQDGKLRIDHIVDGNTLQFDPNVSELLIKQDVVAPGLTSGMYPGQIVVSQLNEAGTESLANTSIEPGLINLWGAGTTPAVPTDDAHAVNKKYVDDSIAGIDLSTKADLVGGKVPAEQLPSYVDDVIEVADYASLPATGEADKIYITVDTNKVYRWSGSTYIEIVASPGSTDAVPEGSTNLYFTNERAKAAAVTNEIVDGVIDVAPSQEAVHTALAGKQASLGTGTTSQYLRGDLTWAAIPKAAKVLTVGVDANTIAGCIALCTSPTATNNYIIEIPSGTYTEDLTIPGNVHLKGLANPNDSLTVKIVGQHTITGASNNALNNRVSIANILLVSSHATTPLLTISGTLAETEVQVTGCFVQNVNTATTAKLFSLGNYAKLYINNSRTRMAGSGQGGTHFYLAGTAGTAGALYTQYGLDTDGGTCVIDMTVAGYSQAQYAQLVCTGPQAIKLASNAMFIMNQSSLTNGSSSGHGVNIVGVAGSFFASHSVFNIQDNASSYVVTGVAGTYYGYYANNYSHIAGVAVRNTKIGPSVAHLRYAGSITSADVNDFQSAARTAAVADSITDGVTNVAPSQNAVYDALALKAASVHTHTASNITDFNSAAKSAVVDDAIVDGVTDKAPSQNAVYDALAGKANSSHTHVAANITDFNTAAQSALSTQLAGKQDSLGTGTTSQYLRGDLTWQTIPAGITPKKQTFVLASGDLSAGYVNCSNLAVVDSMLLMSGGIPHQEGVSEDYVLSTVGGVTRITFNAGFLAKLSVGDRVYVQYCY